MSQKRVEGLCRGPGLISGDHGGYREVQLQDGCQFVGTGDSRLHPVPQIAEELLPEALGRLREGGRLGLEAALQRHPVAQVLAEPRQDRAERVPERFVRGTLGYQGPPFAPLLRVLVKERGVLAGEVVEEGGPGDIRRRGDLLDRRGFVALFVEELQRSGLDGAPRRQLFPLPQGHGRLHDAILRPVSGRIYFWTELSLD